MAIHKKTSLNDAEQYHWGQKGVGWFLSKSEEMTIVEEKIAPGIKEIKHYHERAWQFFYILSGSGTINIDGSNIELNKNDSIEVPPLAVHQLYNDSNTDLQFLIISKPNSYNDRVEV